MAYAGKAQNLDLSGVAGKIALIDVEPAAEPGDDVKTALFTGIMVPDHKPVTQAGAKAVVYIWNGVSDANAEWQMESFFGPPTQTPALWVTNSAGERLKSAASRNAKLKLVLHAAVYCLAPL